MTANDKNKYSGRCLKKFLYLLPSGRTYFICK